MNFPESILKGIPNKDFLSADGYPLAYLFEFKDKTADRQDNNLETSICWKDDKNTINLVLNQKKNGELQFKAGVVPIHRSDVDRIKKLPRVRSQFSYERDKNPNLNNPYHGNLLLAKTCNKILRTYIQTELAMSCQEIITSENMPMHNKRFQKVFCDIIQLLKKFKKNS
ncbi:MAG: hypothetical protein ABR980_11825 [Ignavibacteriaceae bacterium]|jgi:hypothetical protein